ncbi:Aminoglycoside phosphotransferase [Penicillium griseofulvum]|uniref:Altered inheritance of mitochondria protein 9, mitochondrial n=1 Tax=Penicillium patulum TaxID=5078 RepID=A0A135LVA1_PENPA|nr:Aminoglycoside phosphotransferase [Penicillium griseofulvum]KXG52885.1 Aminoglycoside phosphotransferase [Penicillium griseofulvum]
MEFARTILKIPVSRVFGWSATSRNPVGSEYIIIEEATGSQLGMVWDEMTPDLKLKIMREIVSIETKMLSMSFSQDFWSKERSNMDISRGPWSSPVDYALSIGLREMTWIKQHATPKSPDDPLLASLAQNDPRAHLDLLERYIRVVPSLMGFDETLTRSTLWHTDLHTSNLFVDNGYITAVIDCTLLKRPGNFDELCPKEQAQIKQKIFKSTLLQLYLMETEERNPTLAKTYNLDHGKTRRLPIELAGNTWDDDIVSFREALINVERHWKELGIQGDCPIHFTEDDLQSHLVDAEGWNEVQDFFDSIEGLVKRDGWTHHDTFDAAFALFSDLRETGLRQLGGKEKESFEKETHWVEDKKLTRSSQ